MDMKIKDGDLVIRMNGYTDAVDGTEQIIQQVNFAAKIPKGSFIYDRNLGAFPTVPDADLQNAQPTAAMLINESLISTGVKVSVSNIEKRGGSIVINLTADNGFNSIDTEVIIDGQLR